MGVAGSKRARCLSEHGQASVELMMALPVMIAVTVIMVNALLFFSDCAAFDRLAHQAVRVHAASPAYGQDAQRSRDLVQSELERSFARDNLEVSVAVESVSGGRLAFDATLEYSPTLFGMGLRTEVFGVRLPGLSHTASYVVDQYKPGVVI